MHAGMLVLLDRNFDAAALLGQLAATQADLLVRVKSNRKLPVLCRYRDGSYLSQIGTVRVRVAECQITIVTSAGRHIGAYRLATTLLDHRACPAAALISLYHERWEHEVTYLALRHTLLQGRVLRSGDPAGLDQEIWALLALYQALRIVITDATETIPGTDPDRASYQVAAETAQTLVTSARNITGEPSDLAGDIGRAVLASLHPPRRPRVCPRRVKSPLSRWNKHPPGKPRTSMKITSVTTAISQYRDEKKTRRRRSLTPEPGP
jgi:hypothetical protein